MHGAAGLGDSRREGLGDGIAAFEIGQEGGVHVDDAIREGAEGGIFEDAHEACEHHDVGSGGHEVLMERLLGAVRGAEGMRAAVHRLGRDAVLVREMKKGRVGLIAEGEGDLGMETAVADGGEEGVEVRALTGAEYGETERRGLRGLHAGNDAGGAAAGDEGEDVDGGANAIERGFLARVEGVGGVVTAFRIDVRADGVDESGDARFSEKGDVIDAAEGGEDLGAVEFSVDGAGGAFESADRGVGVEGNDEGVAEGASMLEVADVTGVKEVEAAVGEDQATALGIHLVPQAA